MIIKKNEEQLNLPVIAPSILSADFSNLKDEIKLMEKAGAELLHLDIMDGHFVPNISFGPDIVSTVNKISNLFLDVHLMVQEPIRYINNFVTAGADNITIHVEACKNVFDTLNEIKKNNIKSSISLKPKTEVREIEKYLELVDFVLVMSVEPGFGGQKFIPESIQKVKEIKNLNKNVLIEIDGGISELNANEVVKAGVDILVAGNAIFKQTDKIKSFKEIEFNAKK